MPAKTMITCTSCGTQSDLGPYLTDPVLQGDVTQHEGGISLPCSMCGEAITVASPATEEAKLLAKIRLGEKAWAEAVTKKAQDAITEAELLERIRVAGTDLTDELRAGLSGLPAPQYAGGDAIVSVVNGRPVLHLPAPAELGESELTAAVNAAAAAPPPPPAPPTIECRSCLLGNGQKCAAHDPAFAAVIAVEAAKHAAARAEAIDYDGTELVDEANAQARADAAPVVAKSGSALADDVNLAVRGHAPAVVERAARPAHTRTAAPTTPRDIAAKVLEIARGLAAETGTAYVPDVVRGAAALGITQAQAHRALEALTAERSVEPRSASINEVDRRERHMMPEPRMGTWVHRVGVPGAMRVAAPFVATEANVLGVIREVAGESGSGSLVSTADVLRQLHQRGVSFADGYAKLVGLARGGRLEVCQRSAGTVPASDRSIIPADSLGTYWAHTRVLAA